MSKVINITDKFSDEKVIVQVGEKKYPVNDSMETMLKFEELQAAPSLANLKEAIVITLGEKAVKELKIEKYNVKNFKVLIIAIIAAMNDIEYEDAAARFQQFQQ